MPMEPTIDLVTVGRRTWDLIVLGAGPAGALAAREVARRGASVLLVDKADFPREKVCGCCFNPRALAALDSVGLNGLVERLGGVTVHGLRLVANGNQAQLALAGTRVLSRETFDAALVKAAVAAGVQFLPGTQARLGARSAHSREVIVHQKEMEVVVSTSMILAAQGLANLAGTDCPAQPCVAARSRLGAGVITAVFPDAYRKPVIFMACGIQGYVGLVGIEDGRLNIAAAFDPEFVKRSGGLGKAAADILAAEGMPAIPGLDSLAWRGSPLLTRSRTVPAAERLFFLGDAAGYVEPFTGEGIAWALESGVAVTSLAYQASQRWDPALARRWSTLYRNTIARRHGVCRVVTQALRCPTLTRLAIQTLTWAPILAAPLLRYLQAPPSRIST